MPNNCKRVWYRIKVATRYIFKKSVNEKSFTFCSHIKVEDLPKGKWVFASSVIHINEVGDYWLEDVRIMCDSENSRQIFSGPLSEIQVTKN